jgi:hypothetical protein
VAAKQIFRLVHAQARQNAARAVLDAPDGYEVTIGPLTRSQLQNSKMWAMIRDVSNAKPEGRTFTPDEWKCVFMQACGWEVQFLEGLDGRPFPAGFRSSKMTIKQMADLITFIDAYGNQHGVVWRERRYYD